MTNKIDEKRENRKNPKKSSEDEKVTENEIEASNKETSEKDQSSSPEKKDSSKKEESNRTENDVKVSDKTKDEKHVKRTEQDLTLEKIINILGGYQFLITESRTIDNVSAINIVDGLRRNNEIILKPIPAIDQIYRAFTDSVNKKIYIVNKLDNRLVFHTLSEFLRKLSKIST